MTQSEAYETCLKMAASKHWTKVYKLFMKDGFLEDFSYTDLLELWALDDRANGKASHAYRVRF